MAEPETRSSWTSDLRVDPGLGRCVTECCLAWEAARREAGLCATLWTWGGDRRLGDAVCSVFWQYVGANSSKPRFGIGPLTNFCSRCAQLRSSGAYTQLPSVKTHPGLKIGE